MRKSGSGFLPKPLRKLTEVIMVLVVESPRPFSFRVPVALARAQPHLALRFLAARPVDHSRPGPSLFLLALRPGLRRQTAWLEVSAHRSVPALLRRDAHAHLARLGVMFHRSPFREFYRAPVLERSRHRPFVQVLEAG
jgi:hypothetical protein